MQISGVMHSIYTKLELIKCKNMHATILLSAEHSNMGMQGAGGESYVFSSCMQWTPPPYGIHVSDVEDTTWGSIWMIDCAKLESRIRSVTMAIALKHSI